jgi:hypothetical protein
MALMIKAVGHYYGIVGKRLFDPSGKYIGYFLDNYLHSKNGAIIGYKYKKGKWIYNKKGQALYALIDHK